jgi:hypothetical protein
LADPNPEDLTTEEIPGPENVRPVDSLLVVDSSELVDEDAANLTSQPAPKPMRTADLGQGSLTVVPTSTLPLENAEPPLESQPASEPGLDSAATLVAKARAATVEESGVTSVEEPTNETKAQKSPVPLETDSPKSGQKEADSQKSGQKEADSQNSDLKASPPKTASQTSLSPKSEASPKVLAAPDKSGAASGEPQVTPNADLNPPLEPDKPKESPLAADPNDEEAIAEVWVSNLHSTPDEAESQKVWSQVANLTGFGRLYRYDTTVGGIRQWRIRLGFFETREEAEAASGRLLSEAKIGGTPWLVRPTVAERNKYIGQSLSAFWVVNIASTPNQADSEKFWLALEGEKAKNYLNNLKPMAGQKTPKIYRSEAVVNGQKHFRIRLGFFTDQKEAEAAGQALTKAAGLSPSQIGRPWATRPTVDEVKAQEVL